MRPNVFRARFPQNVLPVRNVLPQQHKRMTHMKTRARFLAVFAASVIVVTACSSPAASAPATTTPTAATVPSSAPASGSEAPSSGSPAAGLSVTSFD